MQTATDPSIACTLPANALEQRVAWIRRITAQSLLRHSQQGTALRLEYPANALPELQLIVEQERACCQFLEFSLEELSDSVVALTIEAPHGVASDVRWLFDQFLPQPSAAPRKSCGCAPGACG